MTMPALEIEMSKKQTNGMTVWALLCLLKVYQKIVSPLLHAFGPACRFHPSCSEYARQVVIKDGPWRGSWRALRRISKCHPFHPGGIDHP
jgi:hypothetical protein